MSELQNNTIEGKTNQSSNVNSLVNRRYIEEFLLITEISTDIICSIFDDEHEWELNEYEQQQSKEFSKIIQYYTNNNKVFYFDEKEEAEKEVIKEMERKKQLCHAGVKVPIMNGNVMINISAIRDIDIEAFKHCGEFHFPPSKKNEGNAYMYVDESEADYINAKKHYLTIRYGNEDRKSVV